MYVNIQGTQKKKKNQYHSSIDILFKTPIYNSSGIRAKRGAKGNVHRFHAKVIPYEPGYRFYVKLRNVDY